MIIPCIAESLIYDPCFVVVSFEAWLVVIYYFSFHDWIKIGIISYDLSWIAVEDSILE